MEVQSFSLAVGTWAGGSVAEPKVMIEAPATIANSGTLVMSKPSREQSEPSASALDAVEAPQAALISDAAAQAAVETQEPHPNVSVGIDLSGDAHLSDVFEETTLDYDDFAGKESTRLSCNDDDLWDLQLETPSKPDPRKFTHLFADELKAISDLEIKTPSCET